MADPSLEADSKRQRLELRRKMTVESQKEVPDMAVEFELAEFLMKSGNEFGALEIFDRLARSGFDRPQKLCLNMATCCLKLERYKQCSRLISRCIELPPDDEDGDLRAQARILALKLDSAVSQGMMSRLRSV
jgi:hypothetical protein